MDRAGSCIELRNLGQVQQNNSESGSRQDDRSCGTRAFKWIVRHPFLTATAIIGVVGVVGVASAGIYGLTLLGAAAPVATALSARNVTAKAMVTNASITESPTTDAPATEALTTEAPTTEAPIFRSEDEKLLNSLCKAPNCAFYAISAECTGNRRVRPICCFKFTPYWASWANGETVDWSFPDVTRLTCPSSSSRCTNNSSLAISADTVGKDGSGFAYNTVDELCQSKGWGKAIYRIP